MSQKPAVATLTTVIALLFIALSAAESQQAKKVYRLGILSPAAAPAPEDRSYVYVLVPSALRELGYVQGQNLHIESRFAAGKREGLAELARELVRLRVDLILAVGEAVRAAKEATKTIPIVMADRDPIGHGYVANLARPGGNITGVTFSETGLADKRLELLKAIVPRATRIALLTDFAEGAATQLEEARSASPRLGIVPVVVEVAGSDYPSAFARMVTARASALAVLSSPILHRDRKQIIALAARHRLPTIYPFREHAEDGGLMAYGSSLSELSRRLATYVDRIFKGANPAELPIEQPTRYELVINLKTAQTLGLELPQSLLVQADHVIR